MGETAITSAKILVRSLHHHEFWWSHYKFLPRGEDILHLTSEAPCLSDYGISIFTKRFVESVNAEYISQRFDKTIEQLLQEDSIKFTAKYQPEAL